MIEATNQNLKDNRGIFCRKPMETHGVLTGAFYVGNGWVAGGCWDDDTTSEMDHSRKFPCVQNAPVRLLDEPGLPLLRKSQNLWGERRLVTFVDFQATSKQM